MAIGDRHIEMGRRLARRFFTMRGNHAEVHLNEGQLAALLALAAEAGESGLLPTEPTQRAGHLFTASPANSEVCSVCGRWRTQHA